MLAAMAAGAPALAATRTLSPAEESALATANPSDIIPGVILVQFSRPVSDAELASFEERFHLTYMSDLKIRNALPYYEFHIDDGASPPDKRVQILAGEPLVSWCQPDLRVHVDAGNRHRTRAPRAARARQPPPRPQRHRHHGRSRLRPGPSGPRSRTQVAACRSRRSR